MEKLRLGAGRLWKASRNSRREKRCHLEVSLMSEAIFTSWVSRKPDSIKKPAVGGFYQETPTSRGCLVLPDVCGPFIVQIGLVFSTS